MREEIMEKTRTELKGKIVSELHYDEEDNFYFIEFTDGSEICFRFMSDLVKQSDTDWAQK